MKWITFARLPLRQPIALHEPMASGRTLATDQAQHNLTKQQNLREQHNMKSVEARSPRMEHTMAQRTVAQEEEYADTTIEVGQLDANDDKTLMLYLTGTNHQSNEIVLWHCASPALKGATIMRALYPLDLLRHFEEQTVRVEATCSSCLSCLEQGAVSHAVPPYSY